MDCDVTTVTSQQVTTPLKVFLMLCSSNFTLFVMCPFHLNLVLQPPQVVPGRLQQSVAPLLPLKCSLGHFGRGRLGGAFASQDVLQTLEEQVDLGDGVLQVIVE